MVLPAPVGPTMATVLPGSATSDRSVISGWAWLVAERDVLESIRPRVGASAPASSGVCSSESRISNTRSADATPDCSRLAIDATWVSGWVNCRVYWMKAWTSPRFIVPLATRSPPTTAMIT